MQDLTSEAKNWYLAETKESYSRIRRSQCSLMITTLSGEMSTRQTLSHYPINLTYRLGKLADWFAPLRFALFPKLNVIRRFEQGTSQFRKKNLHGSLQEVRREETDSGDS
jgi:hypothetical protein